MLYHNPGDLTLTIEPHQSLQLLLVLDDNAQPTTIKVTIDEGASVDVLGWVSAGSEATIPLAIILHHRGKKSKSSARIRAVLKGKILNTFLGNVVIPKGAGDVDSFLEYRALLFDTARATATPSLEIEEHPLKAGHAAAIGRVDDAQLFYLQSRGLATAEATQLIIQGFFKQLTDAIRDPKQQQDVQKLLLH